MLDSVYNPRVMELVLNMPRLGRLEEPHGTATAHARLCGSAVTVDVRVDGEGRISDYAHDVRACALGQAAASLMASHAIGMSATEIASLRDAVRAMLRDGAEAPTGVFSEFAALAPVRDLRARHASTLLAFDAVSTALERALAARKATPATAA